MGLDAVISGEFGAHLVRFVDHADPELLVSSGNFVGPDTVAAETTPLDRLRFRVPDRSGLPPLADYPRLDIGADRRVVGYTEATGDAVICAGIARFRLSTGKAARHPA
jgi:hypothetical protein